MGAGNMPGTWGSGGLRTHRLSMYKMQAAIGLAQKDAMCDKSASQ